MHEYRRILALVDFDPVGHLVARRASALASPGNTELALMHWTRPEAGMDGGYPPPTAAEEREAYETAARRRLGQISQRLQRSDVELITVHGPGRQTLLDAIADWRPDLVVAGRDPGELAARYDLLTLGHASGGGGRLVRFLRSLLPGGQSLSAFRA